MILCRKTKTTVLMVGEGLKDYAFLSHLRDIYVLREGGIAVKIEPGSGGSPRSVVEKAIRLRDNKAYDRCVVVLDEDRPFDSDAELNRRMKEPPPIEIIWVNPCMERLLLEILGHPNLLRHRVSVGSCKREFAGYVPVDKQVDKISYSKIFTKAILDSRRSSIHDLNSILKVLEGA